MAFISYFVADGLIFFVNSAVACFHISSYPELTVGKLITQFIFKMCNAFEITISRLQTWSDIV